MENLAKKHSQLKIVTEPNDILRARAKEIDLQLNPSLKIREGRVGYEHAVHFNKIELEDLAQNMVETMKKAPGVGLAAPQIGQSIRLIVVERTPESLVLINPQIVSHSLRRHTLEEGCLSVPGKYGLVKRYRTVKVRAQTLDGSPITIEAKGFLAQIFQHEIDHLNGILYIDKAVKFLWASVSPWQAPRNGGAISCGYSWAWQGSVAVLEYH